MADVNLIIMIFLSVAVVISESLCSDAFHSVALDRVLVVPFPIRNRFFRNYLPLYASVTTHSKRGRQQTKRRRKKQKESPSLPLSSLSTITTTKHGHEHELEEKNEADIRRQKRQYFLNRLNNLPTLVLNANYVPMQFMPPSVWSWQDAVKGIFNGKVTVVDVYPKLTVRASNLEVPLPSVIALNEYVPQKTIKPAFTRRNVFLRDEYRCQYCNQHFNTQDLSLDHVVPRSMGGLLTWDNAVACCHKCNGKKADTPPSQLNTIGMTLRSTPRCPSQTELATKASKVIPKRVHPTWKPYLGIKEGLILSSLSVMEVDEEFVDNRYLEKEIHLNYTTSFDFSS